MEQQNCFCFRTFSYVASTPREDASFHLACHDHGGVDPRHTSHEMVAFAEFVVGKKGHCELHEEAHLADAANNEEVGDET